MVHAVSFVYLFLGAIHVAESSLPGECSRWNGDCSKGAASVSLHPSPSATEINDDEEVDEEGAFFQTRAEQATVRRAGTIGTSRLRGRALTAFGRSEDATEVDAKANEASMRELPSVPDDLPKGQSMQSAPTFIQVSSNSTRSSAHGRVTAMMNRVRHLYNGLIDAFHVQKAAASVPGSLSVAELRARRMLCLFVGMFLVVSGLFVKRVVLKDDKNDEVPLLVELLDPPSPVATSSPGSPRVATPQSQGNLGTSAHVPAAACALLFAAKPGEVELSAAMAAKVEAVQRGGCAMDDRLKQVLAQRLERSECSPGAVYESNPRSSFAHVTGHEVFCA